MTKVDSEQLKKGDVIELKWLDSHSKDGWSSPEHLESWTASGHREFLISTVGYFLNEDENFIRIFQGYDRQKNEGNKDNASAILKAGIKDIKILKKADR